MQLVKENDDFLTRQDPETIEKIIELYKSGLLPRAIGKRVDRCSRTVKKILELNGFNFDDDI